MTPNVVVRPPRWLRTAPSALFLVGLTFLVLGVARPAWTSRDVQRIGTTVLLAVDVSNSMAATDVAPSRIGYARKLAASVIRGLPSRDRIAVVMVAKTPHLVVAPTLDRARALAGLPTHVIPLAGTALSDGISYSVAVVAGAAGSLGPGSQRPGAIVLLSDGGQNAGGTTPPEAIVTALVDYVPVDTVAIGTSSGGIVQPVTVLGQTYSTRIAVPVDPQLLRTIATQTDGTFVSGSLAASTSRLTAALGRIGSQESVSTSRHSLDTWSAAAAVGFILAGIVVPALWFGKVE